MTFLDQLDLTKKTIIVTVSDHGTEFFEHNGIDHGHTLYNELLNTLFAIHLPGQEQGKVVPSLVSSVDFAPTILSLLKISDPAAAQMKGMDLTRAFSGQDLSHDVYSETDYRLYTHKRSVQTPDGWKFILTMENRGRELYDLNTDPGEQTNLVEKETERAYELEQKLIAHLKQMNAADGPWTIGCLPVYMDQCQSLQSSNTATSTTESSKKKL